MNEMILLLGGRGYIGSAFAQRLTELGIRYRTVARAEVDYAVPANLDALEHINAIQQMELMTGHEARSVDEIGRLDRAR